MKNNRVKAEQLKETGAEVLIAPCHNCHSGLEDIVHHYDLNMEIKLFTPERSGVSLACPARYEQP